jgi:hypothetical protein
MGVVGHPHFGQGGTPLASLGWPNPIQKKKKIGHPQGPKPFFFFWPWGGRTTTHREVRPPQTGQGSGSTTSLLSLSFFFNFFFNYFLYSATCEVDTWGTVKI